MLLLLMMAQSKGNVSNGTDEMKPAVFHDFLGRNCASDSSPGAAKAAAGVSGGDVRLTEASPSASVSAGASSGGGRGLVSVTSDLGSERQAANHFEGIPFYGLKADISGHEISNRFAGSKRSNSDSGFMSSSRDGFPPIGPDSLDNSHLMKMLRSAGGERLRRSHDEALFSGMHPLRQTRTSVVLQPPTGSRTERVIPLNIGSTMQYPPHMGQITSFGCQPSTRFKDGNAGPSVISPAAADEGSRTGIKGSRIFSSIAASHGVPDRSLSGVLLSGSKQKSGPHNSEPESSVPPSQHTVTSTSRQMTIFYGGEAHVFDDVHPHKADIIMALAGSNGGSWSTTYASKSAEPVPGESNTAGGENEVGVVSNFEPLREIRGKLGIVGSSSQGPGFSNQILVPGNHQGNLLAKDGKNTVQAVERRAEERREGPS